VCGEWGHAIISILRTEGALGLYRGILANTKVIPNNAIRWMVFEHLKQSPHFKKLFVRFNMPETPEKSSAQTKKNGV
jgi:hypothetical protein